MRGIAYEKLLPPLVANIRNAVKAWRDSGYAGASATSRDLLTWWFETDHLTEQADGTQNQLRYYFAQREAVESVVWLHDVYGARDKFDLLRFADSDPDGLLGFRQHQKHAIVRSESELIRGMSVHRSLA